MRVNHRKYIGRFFITLFLCYGVACGINVVVDPFGIYDSPKIEGLNKVKTEFGSHLRLVKAFDVKLRKPDALTLGTSRAEFGLDPDYLRHLDGVRNPYGLAISGASIYETMRYFQHAIAAGNVKHAVFGLDMFAFNIFWTLTKDFREERLLVTVSGKENAAQDSEKFSLLASLDTLAASYRTATHQEDTDVRVYLSDGSADIEHLKSLIKKKGGQREAFREMEKAFVEHVYYRSPWHQFRLVHPSSGHSSMQYFAKMLEIARENSVDLRLFISPSHARQWELLRISGLWDEWENWKRALVSVVEKNNQANLSRPPIRLWDFSDYDSYSTESLPMHGDRSAFMTWYLDSSHYNKRLGRIALDRIYGLATVNEHVPEDYGIVLNAENIDRHLEKIRKHGEAYRERHGGDVQEIVEMTRSLASNMGSETLPEATKKYRTMFEEQLASKQ